MFGSLLNLTVNTLDSWDIEYRGNISNCWNKVMEHWLNGNHLNYPPTWEGLYELLKHINCGQVAADLKIAVNSWGTDSS